MKTLLMFAYHFPPAQNGGVQRSQRFSEILPDFDWNPEVVSTDLYGKSPNAIHTLEPRSFYRRLRKTYPAKSSAMGTSIQPSARKKSLINFLNQYIYIPDNTIIWLPFAFFSAIHKKCDVIFTTSPPASSHLLGLALKLLKQKPWVMDLRDPWTLDPINPVLRETQWRLSLEQNLERQCFKVADAIILNTDFAMQAYCKAYPEFTHKFHVITNGYNPESFTVDGFSIHQYLGLSDNIRLISHVGTLSRNSNLSQDDPVFMPLLRALQNYKDEKTCFLFLGKVPSVFVQSVADMGLSENVIFGGQLAHNEAIQAMCQSEALLFFDPPEDGETYVRGKLYEYVATKKPILALVSDGASKSFLEPLGNVLFASSTNQVEIEKILEQFHAGMMPQRNPTFNLNEINYYNLTEKLATLLDNVLTMKTD